MNGLAFVMCNLKMNDKGKRQLIDFDEGINELPSDDEWVTEREHGSSSNINLLQAISSATQRKNGKEDDSDEETFNGVEIVLKPLKMILKLLIQGV